MSSSVIVTAPTHSHTNKPTDFSLSSSGEPLSGNMEEMASKILSEGNFLLVSLLVRPGDDTHTLSIRTQNCQLDQRECYPLTAGQHKHVFIHLHWLLHVSNCSTSQDLLSLLTSPSLRGSSGCSLPSHMSILSTLKSCSSSSSSSSLSLYCARALTNSTKISSLMKPHSAKHTG